MPIHLPPMTRRELIRASIATGLGIAALDSAWAEESDRWTLISDTHIPSSREVTNRGINMASNLEKAAREIAALNAKPAGVLLNGDCAYLDGQPGDYKLLTELAEPIRKAGIPLHMTLGNHDHRENFWAAARSAAPKALAGRHVSVIESRHANWFLVDSLDQVNVTPGRLGEEQLSWLAKALDARPGNPPS